MAHADPYEALLQLVADHRLYRGQPTSVQVLKVRELPGRRLYAVPFLTHEGRSCFCSCELRQQKDGMWRVHGSAGGGRGSPQHETPWANVGGSPGNQSSGCYFGGLVESNSTEEIARVRLISADGVILEDTVEEGVVLFQGQGPVRLPLTTEFYDQAGKLIARRPIF